MVVFQAAEGYEKQFGRNIILFADKKALKDFLRAKYNKRYVIDEDEVDDDNGLSHSQAIFIFDYKGMAGIVGYCDCKTFEKVPYKTETNAFDELIFKHLKEERCQLIRQNNELNEENKKLKKRLADRQLADRVTKLEQIVSKQAKNKKSNWTY